MTAVKSPRGARTKADRDVEVLADRLHAAAIRLLRRLRKTDEAIGLSAPQASALSVLVFGGAQTLGALARAEQVRAATMSRLAAELERLGLATKTVDANDRRIVRIAATERGRMLLNEGRARRLSVLKAEIAALSTRERRVLFAATQILERLNRGPLPRAAPGLRAKETAARA